MRRRKPPLYERILGTVVVIALILLALVGGLTLVRVAQIEGSWPPWRLLNTTPESEACTPRRAVPAAERTTRRAGARRLDERTVTG